MVFQNSKGHCIEAGFRSTKLDIITKAESKNYNSNIAPQVTFTKPFLMAVFYLCSKKIFISSSNFFVGLY